MYPIVKPKYTEIEKMLIKLTLIGIGLLIGASIGMYFAVKTLPLPNSEVIYVTR